LTRVGRGFCGRNRCGRRGGQQSRCARGRCSGLNCGRLSGVGSWRYGVLENGCHGVGDSKARAEGVLTLAERQLGSVPRVMSAVHAKRSFVEPGLGNPYDLEALISAEGGGAKPQVKRVEESARVVRHVQEKWKGEDFASAFGVDRLLLTSNHDVRVRP